MKRSKEKLTKSKIVSGKTKCHECGENKVTDDSFICDDCYSKFSPGDLADMDQ